MAKTKQYMEGISEGTSNQIVDGENFSKDKIYVVEDLPSNCGITNEKMVEVVNNILIRAFINPGDVFVCSDEGTYKKGTQYK